MLTAEKTTDSMGSMMKNQFFGDVSHSSDDPKECANIPVLRKIEETYNVRYSQIIFLPLDFGLTETK